MTTNDRFKEAVDLTIDLDLPQDTALPAQQKQHIPVILKDMAGSFEDGVERAALATLATVFGVGEYTQSKAFWESQEATGTGPNSNHRHTNGAQLNSTFGISPMTSKSALTHPLASNISVQHHGFQFSTVSHQQHYVSPHSQQNSPSYLDPMQKDNPLPGSNLSSACTYPVGASASILPDIPAVSNFDDWLTTSSQVHPSKACVVSPSSFKSLSSFPTHKQQRQHYQDTEVAPPLVFYSYPPAIFDLLQSNTDDRIVLWGPDPQYFSISGATMANYSVTSLQQAPSKIGFSSNSTTTISTPVLSAHSGASIRDSQKSATSLITKIKRSIYSHIYPSTTDNNENHIWMVGRLQKKHTLGRRLRRRLSSKMGQQQQSYSSDTSPPMVVQAATVEKLVEILTVTLDYTFMTDFFLTYRTFISPLQLCKLLILRFQWGLKNDEDDRRIVRIRTFVVIRHWLLNYFVHDFKASRELRHSLTTFVNSLPSYALIKQSALDRRIVKCLKRVIRRLKKVHYPKSSQRVQVISPPPPNFDQDHVQGKLSQSSLWRNTHELLYKDRTLDGNWHHGNMTSQEARTADIAVVGTSDKLHLPLAPPIPPSSLLSPPSTNRYGSVDNYMPQSQLLSSPSNVDIDSIRQRKTSQNSVVRYAVSAFSKKKIQQQRLRNVKESYLRRMEQQKLMMMSQQQQGSPGATSDISLDSIISPGTTDDELDEDGDDEEDGFVIANDHLEVMDDRMTQNGSYQVPHEDDRMRHNQSYGNSLMPNHPHRRSVYNAGLSDLSPLVSPSGSVIHGPLTNRFGGSRSNGRSVMKPFHGRQLVTPSSSMDNILPLPMALNMDGSDREKTESAIANEYRDSSETPLGTPISSSNQHLHQLKNRVSKALLENGEENSHLVGKLDTGDEKALIESPSSMSLRSNEFGSTRKLSHRLINASQSTGNIRSARATVVQPATMTASSIASSIHQNSIVAQSNHRHCYYKPDTPHPHAYQQHYGHSCNNNNKGWTPSQSLILDLHTPHRHHYLSDIRASLDEDSYQLSNGIEAEEQDRIYQQPQLPERSTILQQPNDNIPPTLVGLFKPALVLQHRSHSLAQQFCLVEKWILLQIDWEELVHCRWTKMGDCGTDVDDPGAFHSKAGDNQKDGVKQLINRFNMVCRWVSSEILRTRSLDERVLVIEKFIRLAQKCHTYANFATLLQILLGLQSPSISRLEKTWSKVGDSEMRLLKQLSWFTSPTKNWKHLRDSMTAVVEEYGMSPGIQLPFGGCIPFLGLYLSDLVFNSEQSSYLEPNHAHHKIYHSYTRPSRDLSPALLRQPLVNFRKHRITATVIKRFLTFRDLATRYSFEQVDNVYSACFDLDALETESLGQLSLAVEPS